VNDVTFSLNTGETLCLVGESGSGKSMTALSLLRLVPPPGRIVGGRVLFAGRDLLALPEPELQKVRGPGIGLVFQEPATALNPVFRIGSQIAETLAVHGIARGQTARRRAIELLDAVRMPDAARRVDDYPHEMSGGLRQRAMIALALCCNPSLLIADEPTTALDVTTQQQIIDLLRDLVGEFGLSMLFVTHDFGVVAELCDDLCVIYAGQTVESGRTAAILARPCHPYTKALLACHPDRAATFSGIPGNVPSPLRAEPGCRFAPRCSEVQDVCKTRQPFLSLNRSARMPTDKSLKRS